MKAIISTRKQSLVGNIIKLPFKVAGLGITVAGIAVVGTVGIVVNTFVTKETTTIEKL